MMTTMESTLITIMDLLVKSHNETDHDYIRGCDCDIAKAFQHGETALQSAEINFDKAPRNG
jgi:hypothetical protein